MTIALLLVLASALVGAATGFMYRVWALILISPPLAIFSAAVLRSHQFGMIAGIIVVAICAAICQIAYLAVCAPAAHGTSHPRTEADGEQAKQARRRSQPLQLAPARPKTPDPYDCSRAGYCRGQTRTKLNGARYVAATPQSGHRFRASEFIAKRVLRHLAPPGGPAGAPATLIGGPLPGSVGNIFGSKVVPSEAKRTASL